MHNINYSSLAEKDLEEIYFYIKNELKAPEAAIKQIQRIFNAAIRLEQYPKSSPKLIDEDMKKLGLRKLVVDNYIVIYTIDISNKTVNIVRILYQKSNLADKL